MREGLLDWLICPSWQQGQWRLQGQRDSDGVMENGRLLCEDRGAISIISEGDRAATLRQAVEGSGGPAARRPC